MDDLISRALALEVISAVKGITWSQSGKVLCDKMYSQIKDLPAMNAVPMEPQEKKEGDYKNLYCKKCGCGLVGYVGNISKQYFKTANYCNICGQAVKWE